MMFSMSNLLVFISAMAVCSGFCVTVEYIDDSGAETSKKICGLDDDTTVKELRDKSAKEYEFNPSHVELMYEGDELSDNYILEDYNIHDGAIITISKQ